MTPRPAMAARSLAPAFAALALAAVALAGCMGGAAFAPFLRDLGSRITVIGPSPELGPALASGELPPGWSLARLGEDDETALSVAEHAGVRALAMAARGPGALVGRTLRAPLLAMPYLYWGWSLEAAPGADDGRLLPDRPGAPPVPAFLLVGFRTAAADEGGDEPAPGPAAERLGAWAGAGVPPFERALKLVWSADSLTPTGLDAATDPPRYVVRAGLERAGEWVTETVDLSWLYRRAWPEADVGEAEIVFIAAGAGPAPRAPRAFVAGVTLSR